MAMFHCEVHPPVSRARGQSAVATASYIEDRAFHDVRLGKTFRFGSDKTEKHALTENLGTFLADGSKVDTELLWNLAEEAERKSNARTARHIDFAFPREWDKETQRESAMEFQKTLAKIYGVAITISIHREKERNEHGHALITTREVVRGKKGIEFQDKTRTLDDKRQGPLEIERIRAEWCRICNKRLDQEHQLNHRSYKRQGKAITPQIHMGPDALRMERQGVHSDRMDDVILQTQIRLEEENIAKWQRRLEDLERNREARNKNLHRRHHQRRDEDPQEKVTPPARGEAGPNPGRRGDAAGTERGRSNRSGIIHRGGAGGHQGEAGRSRAEAGPDPADTKAKVTLDALLELSRRKTLIGIKRSMEDGREQQHAHDHPGYGYHH